jgi:alpha-ketoglutarate-dependent taurine dioxygenase
LKIRTRDIEEGQPLPLVVEPVTSQKSAKPLCDWLTEQSSWLEKKLHEHGGVLFRGFPVSNHADFQSVAKAISPTLLPYVEGQSPRIRIKDGVYTSTDYPARFRITLHSELSYAANPPDQIIFCCQVAAEKGGQTPIVDCRKVCELMDADIRKKFEDKGVRYVKNMHGKKEGLGKSWQGHYETDDRNEVERYLVKNNVDFEWREDDSLWTSSKRPGIRQHPVTGQSIWHNQSNLWHLSNFPHSTQAHLLKYVGEANLPTHAYYGDNTPIPVAELDHVRDVLWDNASIFPWQHGDVLVLDNYLVAHGRMEYEGAREIIVAMV